MPTAPEFRGGERLVGAVEVLRQAKTHEECNTDGDVGVTREVRIHLQRVGKKGYQVFEAGKKEWGVENAVHEIGGEVVTQDNLFGKAV